MIRDLKVSNTSICIRHKFLTSLQYHVLRLIVLVNSRRVDTVRAICNRSNLKFAEKSGTVNFWEVRSFYAIYLEYYLRYYLKMACVTSSIKMSNKSIIDHNFYVFFDLYSATFCSRWCPFIRFKNMLAKLQKVL